eukprot:m.31299 g.31299  ORF g.31299 m.31299 type:complete len:400 (+) comp31478_c0_seq4:19-1218(+)
MEGGTRKRTTAFHVSVAVLMVVTGTLNTLTMKWADESSAKGQKGVHVPKKCSSLFGPVECRDYSSDQAYVHQFDHPYIQTLFMFIGEMTCFVAFKIFAAIRSSQGKSVNKGQKFNPLIFLPPALCDMFGSSIMILGLTMTTASSFQMLRGSVIIFTGLLSVAFLRNRLRLHHWLGILVVIIGLVVIGVSDVVAGKDVSHKAASQQLSGDLLIIMAQIVTAIQVTYEERFLKKYDVPPLVAVGWEGIFGFTMLGLLMFPFYFVPASFSAAHPIRLENSIDAFIQFSSNWQITFSMVGLIISIAFFNFSGLTVAKELNATTRMVLDSVRTMFVWFVSLGVQWEKFHYLQPVGYVMLVVGTFLYYNLVFAPLLKRWKTKSAESGPLLSADSNSAVHSAETVQ